MFGKRINLFNILGFKVWIDSSWLIIAVLITWSLAQEVFPHYLKGLSARTYWLMGAAGALGLFSSIIIHELCHSLVSRRLGLPIKGITLFIFGGVAEMNDEPVDAKTEFLMAIAGPVSSIALSLGLYGIYSLSRTMGWPETVRGVINYLSMINAILAGFNLIPAYPLDGGRVLRSVLWKWKGNIRQATRTASRIGSAFAMLLIIMGIFGFIGGNPIGGLWWFLIGLFLRNASQTSYQQVLIRRVLEGEPVSRLMRTNPVTVPPSVSISQLVENYIYRYHFKMFPVVEEDKKLVGCVTVKDISGIPREEWDRQTVGEITTPCSSENTIGPETDAVQAISLMNRTGDSRLMVTEDGRLLGIVALKDMLKLFSLKLELEGSQA